MGLGSGCACLNAGSGARIVEFSDSNTRLLQMEFLKYIYILFLHIRDCRLQYCNLNPYIFCKNPNSALIIIISGIVHVIYLSCLILSYDLSHTLHQMNLAKVLWNSSGDRVDDAVPKFSLLNSRYNYDLSSLCPGVFLSSQISLYFCHSFLRYHELPFCLLPLDPLLSSAASLAACQRQQESEHH
jgi:hypothetical protein